MEHEQTKRLHKVVKNKLIRDKLDTIREEQSAIYHTIVTLLKINSDMIQFISNPVKKAA